MAEKLTKSESDMLLFFSTHISYAVHMHALKKGMNNNVMRQHFYVRDRESTFNFERIQEILIKSITPIVQEQNK